MNTIQLIKESLEIEDIHRAPLQKEIDEFNRFMSLKIITVEELERFVFVYQRNAKLRTHGERIKINDYEPPITFVRERLMNLLKYKDAYEMHIQYCIHSQIVMDDPVVCYGTGCRGRKRILI